MTHSATATQSKTQITRRLFNVPWRRLLSGGCLTIAAAVTALNSPFLQEWERQVQTIFFELRGPKVAPEDIVILAI
ncbi:MAG: hypothetical protein AAF722_07130, partial [Cyanobacteria bacterium P01_C01_bin.70]